mgnify:FL=1|tara:strand:- start:1637 stop:1975 length:339 start_codon:yes stop_codon:yes gene_type:complete
MEKELNLLSRINQENFESQTLINHKGKSVVIFSADWCPYCVSFFNNWTEHSKITDAFIADITDVESNLWGVFNIEVVPTMAVFENGILIKRWDGQLQRGLTIDQIESVNNFF